MMLAVLISLFTALHIGLVCPGYDGHLNPTATLGTELTRHGHQVTLISSPRGATTAARHGLAFLPLGKAEYYSGALEADLEEEGKLRGLRACRHTMKLFHRVQKMTLRDLPSILETTDIDGIFVDQLLPAAMAVADAHQIPYGVLCNALPLNLDPAVPPFITTWGPANGSWILRLRNKVANQVVRLAMTPMYKPVDEYCIRNRIAKHRRGDSEHVGIIQVSQIPGFVDFPREKLPSHFFYTQPWHMDFRDADLPFPWESLDGRPLVYVSLGTVQNHLEFMYLAVAEACRDLDVQVVISLGRRGATLSSSVIPSNVIIVDYAPQLRLLRRAAVVVTHAGMNSAMEALAHGLPMVAVPVCNDQPGISARMAHLGVAVVVRAREVEPQILKEAILKVLEDPTYGEAAVRLRSRIRNESPTLAQTAKLMEISLIRARRLFRDDPGAQKLIRGENSALQLNATSVHAGNDEQRRNV
jgi:zeaxanthin glucosyltransferase